MGGIGKEKLVFDTTATLSENDNVGSFIRAGTDGDAISSTNVGGKEGLDVYLINASIAVTASDLDIRDLNYTQDNVAIKGATGNQLVVNADGSINANVDVSVSNGSDKAEDAAHADADIGTYVLSVRQDSLSSSTSANGDYQSFKTDSVGSLWVRPSVMPAMDAPNTEFATGAVSVDDTVGGVQLISAPITNRKRLLIQNLGNKAIYIGGSGMVAGDGIRIAAGGNWEIEAGPAINLYAITATAGAVNVRVFEIA